MKHHILALAMALALAAPAQAQELSGPPVVVPLGGSISSPMSKLAGRVLSVTDFGAKCDVTYVGPFASPTPASYIIAANYAIAAGSTALSLTSGAFPVADVGATKDIVLPGNGTGGAPLITTINVTSTTAATLGAASVPGTISQFILGLTSKSTGSGYKPGDTITMAGGTLATTGGTATIGKVTTTKVDSVTIAAAGTGGTNGTYEVYGTTGNGNRAVFNLTVSGGAATSVSLVDGGHYTTNPTTPSAEPVATAAPNTTLPSGLTLNLVMDADVVQVSTPGLYANGGVPATFTQAATSGTGTGASFTTLAAYNNGGFVYGTDDHAALQTAFNPSTWTTPRTGAIIRMPSRPCGTTQTVTRSDGGVTIRGSIPGQVNGAQPVEPVGSGLQWLGAAGGTMLEDAPSGPADAYRNRLVGLNIECAVPSANGQAYSIPLAATGVEALSQDHARYQRLNFDECSSYDLYTSATGTAGDFIHGTISDISMWHPLPADGIGVYLTSNGTGGKDTDYTRLDNLSGSYCSAPLLRVVTLDNNRAERLHFVGRCTSTFPAVYGVDLSGVVYGSSEASHNNPMRFAGISSTSIARGAESSANPPTDVLIHGFDTGNSVAAIVCAPGAGNIGWTDYSGATGACGTPGAWVAWTPTLSSAGGSGVAVSNVSATYSRVGSTISADLNIHMTATTGPTSVTFTLPTHATTNAFIPCFGSETSGGALIFGVAGGVDPNSVTVSETGGSIPQTGTYILISCTYQTGAT